MTQNAFVVLLYNFSCPYVGHDFYFTIYVTSYS